MLKTTSWRIPAYLALFLPLFACGAGRGGESCLSCHRGIEHISPSHSGCVSCHGGDGAGRDRNAAHAGMRGGRNPSAPPAWEQGCGGCHKWQLERVQSSLMNTNAGLIRNIRLTWEGGDNGVYAASPLKGYDQDGIPLAMQGVNELEGLSGELYRKFCVLCHLGGDSAGLTRVPHGAGCAACHMSYNRESSYDGGDPTVRGKSPHAERHQFSPLPSSRACAACHNRSGRIAFSYEGLYDGNSGLVPTKRGEAGPVMTSGARNLTAIAPDVHFAAGMECIDCHTSRDVMGDGFAYRNMYQQAETACEDCHGSAGETPRYREISRENDEALRESRSYKQPLRSGMRVILTSKGRSYSNVFYRDGAVWLQGKRSGKLHRSKVITGTPAHTIAGHGRLECYSCHSRSVVQCYGCHTRYDKAAASWDFIREEETPGAFSETEDYRMLYPFPLALNQRGRISPVTPGCQTFVSVIEPDGNPSKTEYVSRFKGRQQLRFAPFYSHNTGNKAVGCAQCHGNPAFLGFGQHVVEGNGIKGTLICERSEGKPLDGFLTLEKGKVRAFSAITRENARPLSGAEVKRALSVNLCLPCHNRADDPIYRKGLDLRALDDQLHRRLLSGR